jgi:hypothetical protein
MIDNHGPKKNELTLSKPRGLAIKRLDLVKRGLALIDEVKGKKEVLIGNHDKVMNDAFSKYIKLVVEDKYELLVTPAFLAEEILNFAKEHPIDLFIIVINNIIFRSEDLSAEHRIEKALNLVSFLSKSYNRPVIALYGWPDDPLFPEKAKQAGANYCFKMPFKFEELKKPIEKCLELRRSG